ncbi:MAG TPA: hypothetical protein VFC99_08025 [Acidimicrobiia bacterium]|nr:hypothetical protein [Acidimicrobiia bacterium]
MKTVRLVWLTATAFLLAAAPAGAATPVVANSRYQWFWWIAPILAGSFILMLLALGGGYIKKILLPKYRGRKVE